MSGIKNEVRKQPGLVSGLAVIVAGFILGFQGVDFAISASADSGKVDFASNNSKHNHSEIDSIVTASLGPGRSEQNSSAKSPRNLPTVGHATTDELVVNRAAKADWITTPETTTLPKGPTGRAVEKKVASLGPSSEVVTNSDGSVATEVRGETLSFAPKPASTEDKAYADNADVALFAADMPLPAKLTAYPQAPVDTPLADSDAKQGFPHSPLIPKTFNTGKAFGGLSEIEFQKRERRCMTTALYFEARSEPDSGQIAVGQVIMNRVRSPEYPDTICGVVYQGSQRRTGCQFSFTCDGKADRPTNATQWERSKRLADVVLEGRVWLKEIGHSTHYHATYVAPGWRRDMNKIKRIGHHIFYKSPEVSVTDTYQHIPGEKS